jgi:methylated-DNA-protein-cysteine methyltransferase-like protein
VPRSPHFIRIKGQVLELTRSIPVGRVTAFRDLGDYLEVVPRPVAWILATLSDEEGEVVPWHRVVGEGGMVPKRRARPGPGQVELITMEGVSVVKGAVADGERLRFPITVESTGVPVLPRGPEPVRPPPRRRGP